MNSIKYIILALVSLFLGSCVRSEIDERVDFEDFKTIKFHLESPASSVVGLSSRASSDVNELTIQRGYIFVFSKDGAYKGFQNISASDVVDNHTKYPEITTKISGYDSKSDQLIAVFNYCVDSFKGESAFKNLTKESVSDLFPMGKAYLDELQTDFVVGDYSLGMPMFVNDFDNSNSHSVHEVYRALSRIELYVKPTKVSTSLVDNSHMFSPTNVKFAVVNSAANGSIGFNSINETIGVDGGSVYSSKDDIEFNHVPSEYKESDEISSLPCTKNTIYLYEFPYSTKVITGDELTQGDYDPERLSILIEHEDEELHPGETFYYKLQLVNKSCNEYYDIKRNHDYRVVITDGYTDGYTDLDEAYLMPPSNIEYEIFDDKGDLTFSNGQYAISMDEVLNYESITIYGPATTTISFDNIRRIFPEEVVNQMTAEEIEAMTNMVEFDVVDDTQGVTVNVVKNDFENDGRLTDDGRSIKLELTGDGQCTIKLKISLGNLTLGFDEIVILKVGSDLGGDSSFDAHPGQLRLENIALIDGTWNSVDRDFGARIDGDDMIVYMGENATPVGYKTLNGYITSGAAENAYPYFEAKSRSGYYSYYDLESDPKKTKVKKAKIVLNQLPPFYVGHFGDHASSGPHYYNALIVEKIEEITEYDDQGNFLSDNGGVMNWSEAEGTYYISDKIYGNFLTLQKYLNFVEGLEISKYMVETNKTEDAIPLAAKYCYMKNDIDGDGVIEDDEPIVWYLPAANQMLAMWISKHLINSQIDSKYYGLGLEGDRFPWYWTCSEVAPTLDDRLNKRFSKFVARFNMLEGEMNIRTGAKGLNATAPDYNAHVRCVRNIIYDNTK